MNLKIMLKKWHGLDTFKIKLIACLCMTIDHIGAFVEDGFLTEYYTLFRIIGRIAAPLFLFVLTQSIRYTRDKKFLLKKLYIAGILVGLSNTAFNYLLGDMVGIHNLGNIMFTFFYVAFYSTLIDNGISAIKRKNIYVCVKLTGLALIPLLPCVVYKIVDQAVLPGMAIQQRLLVQGVRDSFLPAINHVNYGVGFVILGIILYLSRKKALQGLVYSTFCIICICGTVVARINLNILVGSSFASLFFDSTQCWMFLALPFIMMYNEKRGRKAEGFFYWYYPAHQYLIIIFSAITG